MNTTSVTAVTGGHGPVVYASLMETPPGRPAPRKACYLVRVPPKKLDGINPRKGKRDAQEKGGILAAQRTAPEARRRARSVLDQGQKEDPSTESGAKVYD